MLKINFDSTDISRQQARFDYLPSSVAFDGTKSLYVGYSKPISNLYFNPVENSATREVSVKYFNGTEFTNVSGLLELTFGFTTPGFISWSKNQTTEEKTTVNGESLYWYQFTIPAATVSFKGINVLFSDDNDLLGEYPSIMEHLPEGATTFVKFHESARKTLITDLRKEGISIKGIDDTRRKQLDAFDILDIEEVREASKFLTLSKIFGWVSDATGDKWEGNEEKYAAAAAGALTPLISLDTNNDGKEDDDEVADTRVVVIGRL